MLESLVATLAALLVGAITAHIMLALVGDMTTALWSAAVVAAALVAAWGWFYIRVSRVRIGRDERRRVKGRS